MSVATPPRPLDVDEFLLRPEREDHCIEELVDGEIVLSPNVKKSHNDIVRRIERLLLPLEEQGFVVHGEVACRLNDYSLPNTDVCAIRKERWDAVADNDFLRESPALVVEVASPGNRKLRLKVAEYPKTRTVLVVTPDQDREVREGEFLLFAGLEIDASAIFNS